MLSLSTGAAFVAGSRELVKLNFQLAPTATGAYPIAFADLPVQGETANAQAEVLATTYSSGLISIKPLPTLKITLADQNVLLTWPQSASNFDLQSSETFVPTTIWTNLLVTPLVTDGSNLVTLPLTGSAKFYRLHLSE